MLIVHTHSLLDGILFPSINCDHFSLSSSTRFLYALAKTETLGPFVFLASLTLKLHPHTVTLTKLINYKMNRFHCTRLTLDNHLCTLSAPGHFMHTYLTYNFTHYHSLSNAFPLPLPVSLLLPLPLYFFLDELECCEYNVFRTHV